MSRIVSVWLPMWPIERMRRRKPESVPETGPFALVGKGAHGLRITAVNRAAAALGVVVGASLPDVRAAVPALIVRPAEITRDAEALRALAGWLGRYGPATNVDGIDGAWVDVTGVPHLFGGEAGLCADLAGRLARLGITVRIGLADTLGAAHALARFAAPPGEKSWAIAPCGAARAALHDLPVASLRLAPEAGRLLMRLGLKRVGQLYGLPRAAIAARFRETGRRGSRTAADTAAAALLLRLDQALGVMREPRSPLRPPPEVLSRLAFTDPLLTADGVEQALEQLAASLAARLSDQGLGARRFRLALFRADGTFAEAVVGTSRPSRDPAHLRRLLAERLAGLDAGFGIDAITLEAGRLEALEAGQIGLEANGEAGMGDAAALVDRLVSRLGSANVRLWTAAASHVPERAELWRPAMDMPAKLPSPGAASDRRGAGDRPRLAGAIPVPLRPPLLLSPPEPITVIAEIPEGAPLHFVWRRLPRRIVRSEGPERIAPEWWCHIGSSGRLPATRDYYRLEDATGARYWVFREGLYDAGEESCETGDDETSGDEAEDMPRWFVHGLFG
ncbi:MAG: DNA polymerase Y family protein [Hyphomicrobiaceae bacterium]